MSRLINICTLITLAFGAGKPWDYTKPSDWYLDHPLCAARGQSPINIRTPQAKYDSTVCNSGLSWHIRNHEGGAWRVVNNGHTIGAQAVSQTAPNTGGDHHRRLAASKADDGYYTLSTNETTISKFENFFGSVEGVHSKFCFDGFHFHWGKDRYHEFGSEHTLNNYSYPLEIHFVHYSCDFSSLGDALAYSLSDNPKDKYTLGVIGVMFNISQTPNPALEKILSDSALKQIKYPKGNLSNGSAIIENLNIHNLIPNNFDFWAYDGSLTTPPCFPIVRWHVLKTEINVGYKQMDRFLQYFAAPNVSLSDNFRPVQDNPNPIYSCVGNSHANNHNGTHNSQHSSTHDDHSAHETKSLKDNGLAVFGITAAVIFACFLILAAVYIKDCIVNKIRNDEADASRHTVKSFSQASGSLNRNLSTEANHLTH